MLYERWREVAREFSHELALRDLPTDRAWTFAQLDAAAAAPPPGDVIFPKGNSAEFVIDVLRAWRHGAVVCPIEPAQASPQFPRPPGRIAHVKLTSATTGAPKLVAFTGEQLAADAENIVRTMGLRRDWPNLAFISLAHSYGFSNLITPLLLHGIPLFLGGHPLPELLRSAAREAGAVTVAGVPALWRVWHEADAITPSVRLAISAGAPLSLALEADVFQRSGVKIHNFYGATECGGIAYDRSALPRSVPAIGAPMENVHLSINREGCLEVRGRNVGETYWPAASPSLAGGVYRTTDVAQFTDGLVFLHGRATDVINIAGRKIAPETIENALAAHPGVTECLVFGAPDPQADRGDAIIACVSVRNGATAESLRTFLLERSEAWQVPREFWIVPELSANQRGKLSRAEWRDKYLRRNK